MTDGRPEREPTLTGRIAVVTGAQQGIGRAAALALAEAGASVIANYLDDEGAAQSLATECESIGVMCQIVQGDLADPAAIDALFERARSAGGTDILVNNAAIFPREDFLSLSAAVWDQVLAINLKAPFLCTQTAARQMRDAGRGGSIINITSGAAFRGSPRAVHYVTSKAGIVGLTRATALELAPHLIRVNAVAPGLTDTAQPRFGMSEEEIAAAARQIPLARLATAEDVAGVIVFLASGQAAHVTGQTWHVNGGQYLA